MGQKPVSRMCQRSTHAGTRVSLYFKGDEEESAIAVNCIRSGEGCKEADPLDKSLTTEHGMQMRLCRCDMGVVTLKEKVLLDDLTGIRMEGSGELHILAAGEVKLEGQEVNLSGNRGVTMYEGKAVLDPEKLLDAEKSAPVPEVTITAAGKVELSTEEGEDTVQNRGEKVAYYLAWEHADLSHPSNRYRDEPEQKDYDWAQWRLNIAAGMVVVGSVTILGAFMAGAAAGAGRIGRRQREAGRYGKICQKSSRRQRRRVPDRSQRPDDAGGQPWKGPVAGIRRRLPGERCGTGTAERRRRDQLGAGDRGRDVLGGDGGAGVEV